MTYVGAKAVHEIVSYAGGFIIGRTKLQKCACALELTGLGYGFLFSYRHFGPYSEVLKIACGDAAALGLIREQHKIASWGGEYSVFIADAADESAINSPRGKLLAIMNAADPVVLEVAVTAAFLATKGETDPWGEVADRKEDKATAEVLKNARALYRDMRKVRTPSRLPALG